MVPIPAEYMPDFWKEIASECSTVELTCLMPNGIIVLLTVNYNATLAAIKEDLWDKAERFPLYGKLQTDMSKYLFKVVNAMAEEEELNDESRRLCDIRPTGGVLIISECKLNSADHSVNVIIGNLIGKGLQDFDAFNSSEINEFRFNMRQLGERIVETRNQGSTQEILFYQFPPRISENDDSSMRDLSRMRVAIKCDNEYKNVVESDEFGANQDTLHTSFQFEVPPTFTPEELLERILAKKAQLLKISNERVQDYVLKVCGRDEYLLGGYKLCEYQYVEDCLSLCATPTLVTVHIDRIPVVRSDYGYLHIKPRTDSSSGKTLGKKKNPKAPPQSSWTIPDNYVITLSTASKVNCDTKRASEIVIQVGLFHGGKPLCQAVRTEEQAVSERGEVDFETAIEFDIQVCNIPRNAKLCFALCEINRLVKGTKSRKPKEPKDNQLNPIAWANMSVYDYKGQLRTGAMTLYMWTYAEDVMSDEVLHPLGTTVSNPNTGYATALTLVFRSFSEEKVIVYPSNDEVLKYANSLEEQPMEPLDQETKENHRKLMNDLENLYDIHDQASGGGLAGAAAYRTIAWVAGSKEHLLSCIDWDKREEVSQAIALLEEWPMLPVEKSLELLDYAYADPQVRRFAVLKCLRHVCDEDLLLYLLQLVQAIKHELYHECDLVKFLIERALSNQRIGHFLFWHLRSEMQVPSVSVRFGLILEAYCRGSQEHIPILQRQLKAVENLKKGTEVVRSVQSKEKAKTALKRYLSSVGEEMVRSPLEPSYRCSRIKVQDCSVMDSKMRPLWIVYENSDRYGEDVYIIFKNGDDLRQDMLTLQMLKIMDRLWKREGLDLKMNPYNCISLEHRVGMIEVVLNAETIANIQKEKNSAVVANLYKHSKKDSILAWLKDYNTTERALSKAIEEFTLSCAGYCVATYVLGIADRHSDNIMIKKSGQLFHIDFGHILGHFKEKFGIKRERVPFVLTYDFVYVINKGQDKSSSALEFKIFQDWCERAFMILRKHGNLILSLFAMMISTGLPELSCEKDLQYLRETLVLSKTDAEALEHFKTKFDEALSNSWKTSLNWAGHNFSKNNKP
ncbi:hypothetical protein D910_04202 [Dendroctonus ponderosae]|uniref:phosphatidylinositol 3-kinase n=1 Tax=Dendroctonus ponderosae TaxID=77166 RepID=U4U148_DENPD|nr:hypothetical protein D910_04202 [Dendroctonus ponderosae]